MRTSRLILFLLISTALSQDTVRFDIRQHVKDSLFALLKEKGDLNRRYTLNRVTDSEIRYVAGLTSHGLDTLLFYSSNTLSSPIQFRHFNPLLGQTNSFEINERFTRILTQYPYLSTESKIQLGRIPGNKTGALILTKTNFTSTVTGLVGVSRQSNETWDIIGEVGIHLENSWKTAGIIDILWKRTGKESQYLNFNMEEPYLFAFPFGVKFGFTQDLRGGSFVKSTRAVQIILFTEKLGRWDIGSSMTNIIPTPGGDSLGIEKSRENSFVISNQVYALDNRWLPTKGYRYNINVTNGILKTGMISTIVKYNSSFAGYYPFTSAFGCKIQTAFIGTFVNDKDVLEGDKIYFGGSKLLRGYPDDFFHDDWVFVQTLELHYTQPSSRIFTFIDAGIAPIFEKTMFGYGFGYSQISENAIISITYGIGENNRLSQGKLHVTLTTKI